MTFPGLVRSDLTRFIRLYAAPELIRNADEDSRIEIIIFYNPAASVSCRKYEGSTLFNVTVRLNTNSFSFIIDRTELFAVPA